MDLETLSEETQHNVSLEGTKSALAQAAERIRKLQHTKAQLEDSLKDVEKQIKKIEMDLAELFSDIGLDSLTLDDGTRLTVQQQVFPTLKPGWEHELEQLGYGAAIKREVKALLDDAETLQKTEAFLAGRGITTTTKTAVHPSTLKKIGRELLESGAQPEHIELFVKQTVKIGGKK